MPATFSEDELVINNSFIKCCFCSKAEDVLFWQQNMLESSAKRQRFREAKKQVRLLREMIDQKHAEISKYIRSTFECRKTEPNNFSTLIKIAAVFVLFPGTIAEYLFISGRMQTTNSIAAIVNTNYYKTPAGQKRIFSTEEVFSTLLSYPFYFSILNKNQLM